MVLLSLILFRYPRHVVVLTEEILILCKDLEEKQAQLEEMIKADEKIISKCLRNDMTLL